MTVPLKVLLVDDEAEIRNFLEVELKRQNYSVETAETGALATKLLNSHPPDLLILDLGLPDMDGQDIIKQLREWSSVPIIVLSARDQEEGKVMALEAGADDYLTKPFGTAELLARIRVAMRHRRGGSDMEKPYEYLGLRIDLGNRKVTLDGKVIQFTPTEYKLLAALAADPGKVITQTQLINEVWGKNSQGNSHYLRIYIQHLRTKLKDDPLHPKFILTEPGVGYRLLFD